MTEKADGAKREVQSTSHTEPETISEEHVQYLLHRHGTVDLIPLPSMDDSDPLNWPSWKVRLSKSCMRCTNWPITESSEFNYGCFTSIHDNIYCGGY